LARRAWISSILALACASVLVVDFDQDVRRATLLGQVGDFFLIRRLQVFVLDADLVEEGTSSARCNR
jgi:hypothetical protein